MSQLQGFPPQDYQQQGFPPQGYPPPMPGAYPFAVPATNGMATAGLVLGILPTGVIGLIFSILGLNRAGKIGGVGRGKAITGIVLSIAWIVASLVIIVPNIQKRLDPACMAAEGYGQKIQTQMTADARSGDPTKVLIDLQSAVTELHSDAAKTDNTTVSGAINALADDFQELAQDVTSGTMPAADMQTRVDTDAHAVDKACGR